MEATLLYLVALMFFGIVNAQNCPSESGWVMYDKKCYKFNAYPRLAQQAATRSCQENGATLLSVNTQPEHQFIANWLLQNDQARDEWLTSGVNTNQGVRWDGDGTLTTSFNKWINSTQQSAPEGQRVLYAYTGTEYGWDLGQVDTSYSFICEISVDEVYRILQQFRDFDYGLNVDNPSQAPRGPTFLQEPEDTVVLGKTNTLYLDCLAKGNPEPSYEWLIQRQGKMQPINADPRFSFTTGKLEIRNPTATDENTYQCKATNNQGTVLSSSAQLSFGFLGEFSNVNPAPVTGNEYDGAQLECPSLISRPGVSYQWYKDDFMIIRPIMQKHIFVSANGRLYFSELTPSDQGTYYCLVTLTSYGQKGNYVGATQTSSRNSLGFGLYVKSGGASQFQPKIQNEFIFVSPQTPTKGGTVRLECFAYGTGPLDYSWSRAGNKPLPKGHNFDSAGRILILNNAELEDGGVYVCRVYSKVTNLADERSVDVVIQSKPYFTFPLMPQHVDIGSRLTWHCEASGQPTPTFQWYKNGNVIENSAGITVNANTLTIESVEAKRDNGMYQCAATNRYGTTFSSAQLRVLELAPSFTKYPMTKTTAGALNGNVTIICNPVAAPLPTYKWSKDGSALSAEPGQYGQDDHYKVLQNGNLIIQNIVASDQGKYTCRVENNLGAAEDYSVLRIMERTAISQKPSDQRVEVNMTTTLLCQASHSPDVDMTYLWTFNDHIINYEREPEYRLGDGSQKGYLYIIATRFRNEGKYTCSAVSSMDQQSVSAYLTVIGPPDEPAGVNVAVRSPMPNDNINDQGNMTNPNTSRWIIWTDGQDRGSIITHYFIEFSTNFDPKWRVHPDGNNLPVYSVTNTQFPTKRYARLTNLKAGAGIQFRVLARNSFGIGPPSLPTTVTQIAGAKPSAVVTNVRGGDGSVGDLVIAWDPLPLEDHNGPDLQYKVSYRKYEATQSDTSKWNTELIPHGTACLIRREYVSLRGQTFLCSKVVQAGPDNYFLRYVVKVQAVNIFGEGPSTNDTIIMSSEEMPLGAPERVFADVYNSTALMVTWRPVPNNRDSVRGKLKGYKINYWRWHMETEAQALQNIIELKPGQTNLEQGLIIGLLPFTWYSFNVQAYNSAGNGPKSSDYQQQTLNKVPSQYPTEVHVYSVEGFGVRVNFRGISTQIREEPLQGYKIQYWKSNENILTAKIADFGKSPTGVIRNLSSSELYELRVYGYNRGGQGIRSSPTVYFTVGDGQIQINSETTETLNGASTRYPAAFIIVVSSFTILFMTL